EGEVLAAQQVERPGKPGVYEQVQATVRHGREAGGVLVNHYHGFTQAARMDRQEMRILCERGTIRLFEWVPTRAEIDVIATQREIDELLSILPDAKVVSKQESRGEEQRVTSRFKSYEVDGRYVITAGAGMDKQALYGHVVRGLLADQIAAIRDLGHMRRVTEENGLTSLATAVQAQTLADAAHS